MIISKKSLPFLIPVAVGVIVGVAVLLIKPSTGKKLGDLIYSSGISTEGYSYAVNKAAPSVVNIYVATLKEDYTTPAPNSITSSASGVIMDKHGIIVTNYHVVPSGNEPNIGDIALAIGNPNNLGQTVTHGIISAVSRSGSGLLSKDQMNIRQGVQALIQTDAPINQGNSGGALVDTRGNLIGINTASFSGDNTYGIGFAIPVKMVREVMDEILRHGKVERGYLGISDDETTALDSESGVRIGYVDPEGPAFGILKIGDLITKVDGYSVQNVRELIDLVSKSKPNTVMNFEIKREGKVKQEKVTLAEDNTSVD